MDKIVQRTVSKTTQISIYIELPRLIIILSQQLCVSRYPIGKKSRMGSRVGGLGTPAGLPADKALAGVPRLLDDLERLSEDMDSADIVFILGREEERVFAHRVILMARYFILSKGLFPFVKNICMLLTHLY